MTEDDQIKMAFDYASEKTKQMITLATGIITITISFSKSLLGPDVAWSVLPLLAAWICYLLSVWYGVKVLGKIAGRLVASSPRKEILDNKEIVSALNRQQHLFVAGLLLTIVFGVLSAGLSIIATEDRCISSDLPGPPAQPFATV